MLDDLLAADKFRQDLLKGGHGKNLKAVKQADRLQRKRAEEERDSKDAKKGSLPTFLRPSDIAGDYDVKRALTTTLGMPEGQVRFLTSADLKAFADNIEQMGKAYKGGITVEQVISLSRPEDIDRANKQIYASVPVRRTNNKVHFATNASRESDVSVHHVNVEFLAFNELVFYPDRIGNTTVRNRLAKGKVKFECDCGRFKYWYRYINTVAGTVLGRKEGGFPKIRNPNLTGIACKHILRVMHWIKSQQGQHYLKTALDRERTKQVGSRTKTGKNEIAEHLSQQIVKAHTKRNEIKPNLNKEVAKLEAKAKKQAQALARMQKQKQTKQQALIKLQNLKNAGVLSDDEFNLLSKNLGK